MTSTKGADVSKTSKGTDHALVARLRSGDEAAFADLVDGMHSRLLTLARTFTSNDAHAEDIVQETWLAVIRGLVGFEGRSSIQTWIISILVRRARTMAAGEARRTRSVLPIESVEETRGAEWEPGRGRVGLWEEAPVPWGLEDPDTALQRAETLDVLEDAVEKLPPMQRIVVLLRDVEALCAADTCNILGITETNQRVLLHRGRARIRRALDRHLRGGDVVPPHPRSDPGTAPAGRSPVRSYGSVRTRGEP